MNALHRPASWRALIPLTILAVTAASCAGSDSSGDSADSDAADPVTLRIGAIPDQDPERLQRTYGLLSDHLEAELRDIAPGIEVEYVPVTEYESAVTGFSIGDLDTVWFGGLTGVQARLEVPGAEAIAQRDIDEAFTSVFIAAPDSGIGPIDDVAGLAELAGRSFTFGSESSTSGRLMPQSFLDQADVSLDDFRGEPGFSGSHDATIEVVAAGAFDVGALNSQVWDDRVAEGSVDPEEVVEIFRTPPYFDYHWVAQPDLDERFGDGFTDDFVDALRSLDADDAADAEILDLFGAGAFIETDNDNYAAIESVGRDVGLIR